MKKILLLPLLPLLLCSCSKQDRWKSPVGWCVWEIEQYEGYDEGFAYTYERPNYPIYEEYKGKNSIDVYIITTYTDELRSEWFCFIEYKASPFTTSVRSDNVIFIDCDVVWEINMEEWARVY